MSDTLRGPDGRIKRGYFSESSDESDSEPKRQCRPTPFRTRPKVTLKTGRVAPTIIPKAKKPKNPRRETIPMMFLTLPAAASAQQSVGKSFATDNRSTILAANVLAEHNHKHGNVAMPDQASLRAWLDDNKREFARARLTRRAAKKRAQRLQDAPRPALADADGPVPAAVHPAARPTRRSQLAGGIVRRARKYCRQMVEGLVTRLNTFGQQIYTDLHIEEDRLLARIQPGRVPDAAEGQVPDAAEGREIDAHLEQVFEQAPPANNSVRSQLDEEFDTDSEEEGVETFSNPPPPVVDPSSPAPRNRRVEPVMPVLDARFFHQDGRLHSVYKYLTAQIPLPRRWVDWAAQNGVRHVHGRGPLNGPGTYIADDTFDYDALHRVIHSGVFRTGRREIDQFAAYWPLASSSRDRRVAHFDHVRRFPQRKPRKEEAKPGPPVDLEVTQEQEQRPGTFGLPASFYDSSSGSDSGSGPEIRAAPAPTAPLVSRKGDSSTANARESGEGGGRPVGKQHQTPPQERSAQLQGDHRHRPEEGNQKRQTPLQERLAQLLANPQQQVVPSQRTQASGREASLGLPQQQQAQQPQPAEAKAALDSESTEKYRELHKSEQHDKPKQAIQPPVQRRQQQQQQQQKPEPPKQPSKRKADDEHQPQPAPQKRQQQWSWPLPSFDLPGEFGLYMSGRAVPREPTSTPADAAIPADQTRDHQPRPLTPPPPPPPQEQQQQQQQQQTRPLQGPAVRTPENRKLKELNPPTWSGKRRVAEQLRREEEETLRRQAEQRREAEDRRLRAEMRRLDRESQRRAEQQKRREAEEAEAERARHLDEMITAQEDAELAAEEAQQWQKQQRVKAAAFLRNARANLRTDITTQIATPSRRKDVPSPPGLGKQQQQQQQGKFS